MMTRVGYGLIYLAGLGVLALPFLAMGGDLPPWMPAAVGVALTLGGVVLAAFPPPRESAESWSEAIGAMGEPGDGRGAGSAARRPATWRHHDHRG